MGRMDEMEDDARYPPNPYHSNHSSRSSFPSCNRSNVPRRNTGLSSQIDRRYHKNKDEDESDAEEEELNGAVGAMEDDDEEDCDDDEDDGRGSGYDRMQSESSSPESRGKRRKLNKFALGFEFARRAEPPAPVVASATGTSKLPARNNPTDWTEDSTFVLLGAWGELYIQNGRKSLRSDEWTEVAKKVNESSRTRRTDAQCRNRLDTLKKKYKKEKAKMADSMSSSSKWVYFKKMEELMGLPSPPQAPWKKQQLRLPCGVDSGEYVFANSRHYLNPSSGLDDTRDSPAGSEMAGNDDDDDDDDESDGLPPQTTTKKARSGSDPSAFRMLAESIQKFSKIYEKMENSKRQHMAELEKMRREFHRDLEVQKRQILGKVQEELEKLRQEQGDEEETGEDEEDNNDNDDVDCSAENASS